MFTNGELAGFFCDKFARVVICYSVGLIAGGAGIGVAIMVFFQ